MPDPVPFSDLRTAAYCPRQLWYRRRDDDRGVPDDVSAVRDLAFRYPDLLDAADATLSDLPVVRPPSDYRERLRRTRDDCDRWTALTDPAARDRLLTGRDCRGRVQKVLADPPAPSLLSPGEPPPEGVWERHTVWAVAAAKALAWERERPVETAYVEYPAHGVVRRVPLTTRRKALYRKALRAVRSLDGPPPRLRGDPKCETCEFRAECGVRTRTLRSLLPGG